jgi:oligosaccharide repeat unit polymerase
MSLEATLLWYVFLACICISLEKTTKCFSTINIFTIFIYSFLIKHGITIPFNVRVNAEQLGLELSQDVLNRWIISLVIMYICFVAGILIAQRLFGKKKLSEERYNDELNQSSKLGLTGVRKFFPLFAIGITLFTFSLLWNPSLITQALFSDDFTADAYKASRTAYGKEFSSDSNIFLRIANTFKLSVLPLCLYIMFFIQKIDKKFILSFWLMFLATFLVSLSSGQKAGAIQIIIGVIICKTFSNGKLNISISGKVGRILSSVVLLLLFVVFPFQYRLQYPNLSYQESIGSVFYRLGGETSRVLQLHFYAYPDIFPHLLGASSRVISNLLGDDRILDPARVIRGYILFNDTTDGTGSWNAAFIGAAWADFNYIGVVLQSLGVSMLLWYYHQWFIKKRKTAGVLGTYVTLSLAATYLSEGNLLTTFLTGGLVLNFGVYLIFKQKSKINSKKHLKQLFRLT